MAVFAAEEIFSKGDLGKYYTCRVAYPIIMRFFEFEAEIGCVIKEVEAVKEPNEVKQNATHDKLNYFYTEVKGYDFSVKLFSSLTFVTRQI